METISDRTSLFSGQTHRLCVTDATTRKLQRRQSRNSHERFSRAPLQILHLLYPIRACDTAAATARTGTEKQRRLVAETAANMQSHGVARYPSPRAASPIRIGGYPCRAVLESRESRLTTTLWAIRAPHSTASTYRRLRAAARTGLQGECPIAIVRHRFYVESKGNNAWDRAPQKANA